MAVANDTIIRKMIDELNQAKTNQNNHAKMVKHIASVRLLCDLFLDEEPSAGEDLNDITPEEMKAMIGGKGNTEKKGSFQKRPLEDDNANGDSLFDF